MERPAGVVDFTPDPRLFPFESRWFDSSVGPVHFIDEGTGPTLLLMHGNPDWSFLYRKIVLGLRGEFRCVVLDYPGFGLSAHPRGYHYTPAEHAVVVGELVDHLDLRDMIVMGQDWGGPIGMEVASRRAERVRGLVMGNTWFWPENGRTIRTFSTVMSSRPIQWLITNQQLLRVSPDEEVAAGQDLRRGVRPLLRRGAYPGVAQGHRRLPRRDHEGAPVAG